jgi:ADP-heptose:LPS heptosyltransferase
MKSYSFINVFNLLTDTFLMHDKKINLENINKILFIHIGNSGIGDVIMSLPVLKILNEKFGGFNVDVVYPNEVSFLFKHYDRNRIYYKKKKGLDNNLVLKLRKNKYDLIITNHPLSTLYGNLISLNSHKIGIFYDFKDPYGRIIQSNFKNYKKINQLTDDRISKNLLILYSLGLIDLKDFYEYGYSYDKIRSYFLPYFTKILKKPKCFENSKNLKIVFYFKKWSIFKEDFLKSLIEKIKQIRSNVVFYLVGPSYDSLSCKINDRNFIKTNDLSWEETLYIVNNSDLVICGDSSILHFSLLFGKKTIGLFPYHISPYLRVPYENLDNMIFINSFLTHDASKIVFKDNIYLFNENDIWIRLIIDKILKML